MSIFGSGKSDDVRRRYLRTILHCLVVVGYQEISNLQEDITKKSTAIAHYTTLLARWQSTLSSLSDFTSTALSRSYRDEALVQEHVNRKRKIPTEHDFAHLDDVEDNPYASGKVEAGLSPIVGLRDSGELGESNVGLHTTLPPQALNADAMFLDLTLDEASGFGGDVLGMTSLDVPVPSSVPADMGEQTSELLNIFSGPQMPSGDSSSLDNFAFTSDLSFDTMPLDSQGPSDGDAFVGLGGNFSWNLSAFGDTGSSAQTEDPEQAQPAQNSTADQTTISEAGDDIFQFIVNDG